MRVASSGREAADCIRHRHQRRMQGVGNAPHSLPRRRASVCEFPKIMGTLPSFGVLIIRILLFRHYIRVPYFRKPPYGSGVLWL